MYTSSLTGACRHLYVAAVATIALVWSAAGTAQVTFDVIGPGEYDLPVDFDPFNVFVQYVTLQDNDKVRDADGNKVDGPGTQQIVGLSKYVRFWSPQSNRRMGAAYEIIVPAISVRDRDAGQQTSGIGDPLTGFAIWFKPSEMSTLGLQSFLQVPVGDDSVSDTNWKNLTSLFWNWRRGDFQTTGNAGFVWQDTPTSGPRPAPIWHTNQRFSYRVTQRWEPFVGLDYETTGSGGAGPSSWAFDAGAGLMLHTFSNQSIALRYSTTLRGKNHAHNDSLNLRYVYAW